MDVGQRLHVSYEVLKRLGAGGMAETFLAKDTVSGRFVVVKTILPGLRVKENLRKRFAREGRILSKLHHQNVVGFVAGSLSVADPWFIMEYCSKGSLDVLAGTSGFAEVLSAFHDACRGMVWAHSEEVVHRDLKPSNILVGDDGQGKVADFGLAYIQRRDTTPLTRSGEGMGTLWFMAPEQIRNAKSVGPAADVYSLGRTLQVVMAEDGWGRSSGRWLARRDLPAGMGGAIEALAIRAVSERPEERMTAVEFTKAIEEIRALSNE